MSKQPPTPSQCAVVPAEIDRERHANVLQVWNACMANCETLEMTWPKLVKAIGTALPAREKLPCGCFTAPAYDGCTCGNSDDANSQGYAIGWNAAIDKMEGQ